NLTRDHLEYHGSMESYGAAKARLFALPGIQAAIINLDDTFGVRLAAGLTGVRRIGYTLGESSKNACVDEVLVARNLKVSAAGLSFTVHGVEGDVDISSPLLGRFNAANLLAVLGALLAAGVPLVQAAAVLTKLSPPPGRMQVVTADRQNEPLAVVDYAHTPDALEQALVTLREVASSRGGKLICLFGCGGDRDPGKRPLMGEIAARLADTCIVTSDNPRGEDPQAIINAILCGMDSAPTVEIDRAKAIRQAVLSAAGQDVLLIAGKGHEPYQEISGRRLPFSDIEQAQGALLARRAAR
ncbi:MAG: Mur ligase family protein, partial [Nevskiales bacterium]